MPPSFEEQEYWHKRFATEANFEWLCQAETFMNILKSDKDFVGLQASSPVLQLGFGTSDLHNYLRNYGLLNVLNVDYEPLAIERGKELEKSAFSDVRMKYAVADATQLDLPEKFDFVTDKSTVDAVSCAGEDAFLRMCHGIRAHLAPGGFWISMSYSKWRFEVDGLPFHCQEIESIPTTKLKETDPDIFYHCYKLVPKTENELKRYDCH